MAAEDALIAARALLGCALAHTVIIRIEEHGVATISMQKTNVPINLDHHLLACQRSDRMDRPRTRDRLRHPPNRVGFWTPPARISISPNGQSKVSACDPST